MDGNQAIGNSDIAITVEMGDEFQPGPRTVEALQLLVNALQEEHGDHEGEDGVAGYQFEASKTVRSFSFMSSSDLRVGGRFEAWPSKWKDFGWDGKDND